MAANVLFCCFLFFVFFRPAGLAQVSLKDIANELVYRDPFLTTTSSRQFCKLDKCPPKPEVWGELPVCPVGFLDLPHSVIPFRAPRQKLGVPSGLELTGF